MTDSALCLVQAQSGRWYVVGLFQGSYGKPGGYATEAEAQAVKESWEREEDDD